MTRPVTPAVLYSYTCDHGKEGILASGSILKPNMRGDGLVWLTDLPVADRAALGLTSYILRCDRTRWRFTVDSRQPGITAWVDWCRAHRITRQLRERYEGTYGARPLHWWVSDRPVEGRLS